MVRPSSLECHVNLLGHRIFLGARPHLDLQDPPDSGALDFFTALIFSKLEIFPCSGLCASPVCASCPSQQ